MLAQANGLISKMGLLEDRAFKMKYKNALIQSMEMLAKEKNIVFVGYNVNYGSRMYGTLSTVPKSKCLETPLAENLMAGMCICMALEGYKPVLIFERHDFILNSLDALVNHLDKIESMSEGQFTAPVIIRAVVGSKKPLDPGPQHTQDFTKLLKEVFHFPVIELNTSEEIIKAYESALSSKKPAMLIEKRDMYDMEC